MAAPDASSAGEKEAPAEVGYNAAYEALTRGDVDKIDDLLSEIDKRVQDHPDDGFANFYAATFRLWKLSEATNTVEDVLFALPVPEEMLTRFERAQELMPDDFRVPGFFGLSLVSAGGLTGDDATVKRGLETLDDAVARYPAYGYFLRATATSGRATDDPLFATTVSDMVKLAEACLLDPGDDQIAYPYPTDGNPARPRVCTNEGIVPHVWEGIFISFGDMALKSGWGAERAKALYRSAQGSPSYDTWPFASALEERIQNAESGAAAYADADPFNDPTVWALGGHICVGCHQAK